MNTVFELREEREALENKMVALHALAENENRDFTDAENTSFLKFESDIRVIDQKIERAETIHRINVAKDKRVPKPEDTARQSYSLVRAIGQYVSTNGKLSGIEAEMDQEAKRINPLIGGIGVPSFVGDNETRAGELTVGTAVSAGNAVATDLSGVVKSLQPTPQMLALGAEMKTGLVGDYEILRNTVAATASWEGEIDANAITTPQYDKLSLTPNRLGAFVTFGKQLMAQNTLVADRDLTQLIRESIARLLDATCIDGDSGGSDPFDGITNTAGIGSVALGAAGAAPTWASIVQLEAEIFADNAEVENMNYLTHPIMRGYFKSHFKDAGSGMPFMSGNEMNGYGVATSTLSPSGLTKGASTDCYAIIFGNFRDMVIGQWANGYDIVVDPFTGAKNATINIVVNSWYDMVIKHAQSFAACLDARNI